MNSFIFQGIPEGGTVSADADDTAGRKLAPAGGGERPAHQSETDNGNGFGCHKVRET